MLCGLLRVCRGLLLDGWWRRGWALATPLPYMRWKVLCRVSLLCLVFYLAMDTKI
jgi:hypothetical protein